jgi:4-hydroxy-tetrahydrodipicolinate reductase
MRVAIVGYGKMGREIAGVLRERSHEPVPVLHGESYPRDCPVGVDFTTPDAVVTNVAAALETGSRYVVGTTGWADQQGAVREQVGKLGGGLVFAANFSLGVNLFYRIARQAAAVLAPFPEYDPYVLDRHHRGKKDAPSGTARVLAGLLSAGGSREVPVSSVRAGGIVGDHVVGFDSGGDEILLEHRARDRRGFALGAVLAAEWIATRRGFRAFDEVLEDLLHPPRGA